MINPSLDIRLHSRGPGWKWWICCLLLLATTINYVDRLTVNQMSKELMDAFSLKDRGYGLLEAVFGRAFAIGAIVMGYFADRVNVRLLYPLAVIAWSLAGFATGLAQGFADLLLFRFLLGLAEAGNWSCALRTTQRILTPAERTLGNGILQSGAAIGAVITPLMVIGLLRLTGSWRAPFMVAGTLGMFWAYFWLASVRKEDLEVPPRGSAPSLMNILGILVVLLALDLVVHVIWAPADKQAGVGRSFAWVPLGVSVLTTILGTLCVYRWLERATRDESEQGGIGAAPPIHHEPPALPRWLFLRRFWVLAILVVTLNINWHFLRAWLPPFLTNQHNYTPDEMRWFSMLYYLASDSGSLIVGFAALGLVRLGMGVHGSRVLILTVGAATCCLALVAAVLPAGPLLLGVLLGMAFAALGVFPVYYSLSQELTVQHQGKLTGALGCVCWLSMALMQELAGESVMVTGSYSLGMTLAGLTPLLGLTALLLFWGRTPIPVIGLLEQKNVLAVGDLAPTSPRFLTGRKNQ